MRVSLRVRLVALAALVLVGVGSTPQSTGASHAWGNYHWARTGSSFTVKLGDNVSSNWDSMLRAASTDWSKSTALDTTIVAGAGLRRCGPVAGRVEVCNDTYGTNGWLGLAQIWLSNGHISQGTSKMNDTYFNMAAYNTPAERYHVMCQEVGHTFGLGHQDESGASLGTCMDYADDSTNSQHPNAHDYDMLKAIYGHTDSTNGATAVDTEFGKNIDLNNPAEWGRAAENHTHGGRQSLFVRDFGGGRQIYTFVVWADKHETGRTVAQPSKVRSE